MTIKAVWFVINVVGCAGVSVLLSTLAVLGHETMCESRIEIPSFLASWGKFDRSILAVHPTKPCLSVIQGA